MALTENILSLCSWIMGVTMALEAATYVVSCSGGSSLFETRSKVPGSNAALYLVWEEQNCKYENNHSIDPGTDWPTWII